MVAAFFHLHGRAGALGRRHGLDGWAVDQRLIDDGLQLHFAAAPIRPILGDDSGALRVVDTVDESVGREAAEDHRVDRADARAGEQRDRQLGSHPHVDRDAVALLHAEAFRTLANF
jgi:hypothetical protein